jgi:hypothetical protein
VIFSRLSSLTKIDEDDCREIRSDRLFTYSLNHSLLCETLKDRFLESDTLTHTHRIMTWYHSSRVRLVELNPIICIYIDKYSRSLIESSTTLSHFERDDYWLALVTLYCWIHFGSIELESISIVLIRLRHQWIKSSMNKKHGDHTTTSSLLPVVNGTWLNTTESRSLDTHATYAWKKHQSSILACIENHWHEETDAIVQERSISLNFASFQFSSVSTTGQPLLLQRDVYM